MLSGSCLPEVVPNRGNEQDVHHQKEVSGIHVSFLGMCVLICARGLPGEEGSWSRKL